MKKFRTALILLGLVLGVGLMVLSCGDEEKPVVPEDESCVPTSGGWTEAWCTDGIDNDCDELIDEDDAEECLPIECQDEINPNVPDPFLFYGASPTGVIASAAKLEEILGQMHRIIFDPDTDEAVTVYIDMMLIGFTLGEMARDWVVGQDCYEILGDTLPDCATTTDCVLEEDFGKASLDFGEGCKFSGEADIGEPDGPVTISGGLEIIGYLKRNPSTGEPDTVKVSGQANDFSSGPNTFNCGIIEAYVDYDTTEDSVSKMPVLITMNGVFDGEPIAFALNAPNSLFNRGVTIYYIDGDGNIYRVYWLGFFSFDEILIEALDAPGGDICELTLEWDSGTDWDITTDVCETGIAGPITGPDMSP
jgi:hypothetical protein